MLCRATKKATKVAKTVKRAYTMGTQQSGPALSKTAQLAALVC